MSFHGDMATMHTRLLGTYGTEYTFARATEGAYSTTTLTAAETTTTFTGTGVVVRYRVSEVDGTQVQSGDLRLVLGPMDTAPQRGDTVTISDVVYRVMEAMTRNPGGTVYGYELQVRI